MNFNFRDLKSDKIGTFEELKGALQHNFNELLSKGYLYKGDMGETPQIVNRELIKEGEWTALGKSVIEAIFKDTKNKKYEEYYKKGIDALISELTKDGKLDGLNGATYPWWCADRNSNYPIYPATYFVYVDSTPNNIRNDDERWKDNSYGKWEDDSCVLIPEKVDYSDYSDEATAEELEPVVIYHKNHIYPTFYFDSNAKGAAAGAWCWEINGVQTGVPASVANDDGSVLGHMFIFKNEGGVYYYKAGVNPNADEDWMTMEEMKKANLRYPIKGDIGFAIKMGETNINTLQIYNFVENNDGVNVNGGDWGLGGNLISFGESFYKALWKFISSDSGIEINKGKIILGTTSGNHCIFVKNDVKKTGQTLVLMPYQGDPSEKTDFADDDIWKEAKLQLNYPETTINGAVNIKGNLDVSDNINAGSINISGDITECKNIKASGSISTEGSISCGEITANNFTVNRDEIIIGSNNTTDNRVNILSDNFSVTDSYIDTKLPFTSSNNINISNASNKYIKIHADNKLINTVRTELSSTLVETSSNTVTIISGGGAISPTKKYNGSGEDGCTVEVAYTSKEYDLPTKMENIVLTMPYSLGIAINVKGENNYGSWPLLKSGSMILKLIAKTIDAIDGTNKELYTNKVTITENNSSGFNNDVSTKYCTIYCSIPSDVLNSISSELTKNKNNYSSIYITAEAVFNLETKRGTWGQQNTIYQAGTDCYICSRTLSTGGGSAWSSANPAKSVSGTYTILKADIETQNDTSSDNIKTVHICPDGILIGKTRNNSAVLYIDDSGFHINYYRPTPGGAEEKINILSINTLGKCTSGVFQLKQTTTSSSESKK